VSLSSDPTGSSAGQTYYNTTSDKIRIYTGTIWIDAGVSAQELSDAIGASVLSNTDDLSEGSTNLYYTDTRVGSYITNNNISLQGTTGAQGTQGILGAQGATGAQGETGIQGAIGSQGTTGTTGAQGTTGSQGTTGAQGIQGFNGADGGSSSYYNYKVKTGQTSGDPGSGGYFIYNNATQTSATQLNIDHLTTLNVDIDVFLSLLKSGDTLIIQDENDSNNYQKFTVSGAETIYPNNYVEVPVTFASSGGTGTTGFANNAAVILVIVASGVQGVTGSQGATGAQGTTGSQGTQGLIGTISPDDSWYYSILF
jgi:hypothetical protein